MSGVRVLTVNCGSSSLKWEVVVLDVDDGVEERVAGGSVDGIGGAEGGIGHARAMADVVAHLGRGHDDVRLDDVDAVGHRIVHGGQVTGPALLDEAVLAAVGRAAPLAPLHNARALAAIHLARAELPGVPMVGVFDTAFHAGMPARAASYAIAPDLAERHGIRRHGFHGLAHRSMVERWAAATGADAADSRLVTLQLGSGASACAVDGGRSVDTTMGLTPAEGLVMGSRSGDVDPMLAGILARAEEVDLRRVEGWLTTGSGLLGVSGRSSDVGELLEAEAGGDERAALALELFCYRARKHLGAHLAALGGADAVCLGGGIAEHAPEVRRRVLDGMGWCGLHLDEVAVAQAPAGTDARLSADDSPVAAWLVAVDEGVLIARDTADVVRGRG